MTESHEVNKAQLVKKIMKSAQQKVEGLLNAGRNRPTGYNAIELKRDADAQGVLNYLFKNTELQITYNFNMVAINHMRPEHVGLKTILTAWNTNAT